MVIHTDSKPFEIYATMTELEKRLGSSFYRCHRGYLVNLGKIKGYDKQSIRLTDDSRRRPKPKYSEFVNVYMRFLKCETS